MSHGHLSKVERGEHGRPITPAVLAAYERATGVSLADAAAALAEQREGVVGRRGRRWLPGQLSDMRRLGFNAAIGALAAGGQLGEPFTRLLDSAGRPGVPIPPRALDAVQVERVGQVLTGLDLQYGGRFTAEFAKAALRWAVPMLELVSVASSAGRQLYGAVAGLAGRAAWAAFDAGGHEPARSLFRLALYTAVRSGDADLRAHLVADAAAQHNHCGYHDDALDLVRMVEGDERVSTGVRMVLHWVRARAYGRAGAVDMCWRQVAAAEQAYTEADPSACGWVGRLRQPGRLSAATGHAVAAMAQHSGMPPHLAEARRRLGDAVEQLDRVGQARSRGLCLARLAVLCVSGGDLEEAAYWGDQAVEVAELVQSARLRRGLGELRRLAAEHADVAVMAELVEKVTAHCGTEDASGGDQGASDVAA